MCIRDSLPRRHPRAFNDREPVPALQADAVFRNTGAHTSAAGRRLLCAGADKIHSGGGRSEFPDAYRVRLCSAGGDTIVLFGNDFRNAGAEEPSGV